MNSEGDFNNNNQYSWQSLRVSDSEGVDSKVKDLLEIIPEFNNQGSLESVRRLSAASDEMESDSSHNAPKICY